MDAQERRVTSSFRLSPRIWALLAAAVVAIGLIWVGVGHATRPPLAPVDVSLDRAALADLGSPITAGDSGTESIARSCVDNDCVTVARTFHVPKGWTLSRVVETLDRWSHTSGGSMDGVQCIPHENIAGGTGVPVGQCWAVLRGGNGRMGQIDIGIRVADQGPAFGTVSWRADGSTPVAAVVIYISAYRPGVED